MSLGHSARVAETMTLSNSAFRKSEGDELGDEDTEEDVEDESQGLDDKGQDLDDECQGLDDEGQGLEDEGPGMEEEDAAPEGQQQAVLVVDTAMSKPLGLGYRAARRRALYSTKEIAPNPEDGRVYTDILTYVPLVAPVQTPPSPEWSLGSLPVSPSSLVVPSPIASLVATLAATISVDEDHFIKDLRELYSRLGEVRDEIFSQRYRFRSLDREQERVAVTFSVIWRSGENHYMRRQLAKERCKRLELTDRVARMERRQEFGGN
ncbi:hypothetical protein Tco_1215167 [Tanacetum coccineum]